MAIHFPKNLSYQARFDAWVSGICPYCDHRSQIVKRVSPTKKSFACTNCGSVNHFTLPRLMIEEKPQ